jgi:hypothetical protein
MPPAIQKPLDGLLLWTHRILMPIATVLMAGALGIMGAVGRGIWAEAREWMQAMDHRVVQLELKEARSDSNRFTSQHWTDAKSRLDEDRANMDRRVTRLEESVPQIKESMIRIETKIDKLADRK